MRAKESLLRNFFCNVELVLRTQKVAATSQRWEVSKGGRMRGRGKGGAKWCGERGGNECAGRAGRAAV